MAIERTEFSSGLRVVTERMPGVRSVSLGFWVLPGSRDEPPAISGSTTSSSTCSSRHARAVGATSRRRSTRWAAA